MPSARTRVTPAILKAEPQSWPSESTHAAPDMLRPGEDCWRVERAHRAAVLIDAEQYFMALRAAMLKAERCIHIVGWDLDRRTPFPGCAEDVARLAELGLPVSGAPELAADGYPLRLGDFLAELVRRKPRLWIRILIWDFSLWYATDREAVPLTAMALRWKTPMRLDLCLDDAIPLGSAHHQKLVVIDDALAFCGGMDITLGRWDDCAHARNDDRRRMLDGAAYPPVHDVQLMVDGPAAGAMAEYVRGRWTRAAYETLHAVQGAGERAWPDGFSPDFTEVGVAMARTEPGFGGAAPVAEVEKLYASMIRGARRAIYIENQYLTSELVAASLTQALQENPELEAVILSNNTYVGWLEGAAMIAGRRRFMQRQEEHGVADRVRLLYPRNDPDDDSAQVKVHSKLLIVDDRLLRVGSSNLCRRSMGSDTEFDAVIVAETAEARASILAVRDRLLAEHCSAEPAEIARAIADTGSLIRGIERVNGRKPRHLAPIPDAHNAAVVLPETLPGAVAALADPEKPIDPMLSLASLAFRGEEPEKRRWRKGPVFWLLLAAVIMGGLAALWTMTPLSGIADVRHWEGLLAGMRGPWEGLAAIVVFVVGGFVAFPLVVLIAGTTAVFGVWPGVAYAGIGAMASALATYGFGWWLGQRRLRRYFGPGVNRIKQSLKGRGIITVTTIRLIPAAPYTLVNLAAGALHVPPLEYTIGTALGLAPGLIIMSLLGGTIVGILAHPTFLGISFLVGLLVATILLSFGLQILVRRIQRMFE